MTVTFLQHAAKLSLVIRNEVKKTRSLTIPGCPIEQKRNVRERNKPNGTGCHPGAAPREVE